VNKKIWTIRGKIARAPKGLTENEKINLSALLKERGKLASKISGPGYRLYYVRYADDFLIGLNGPERIVIQLKEKLKTFLAENLKLTLNILKTKITSSIYDKAYFLGTLIHRRKSRTRDAKVVLKRRRIGSTVYKERINEGHLILSLPFEKIIHKLEDQSFCRIDDYNQGQIVPVARIS
jgi:hypothetical protein